MNSDIVVSHSQSYIPEEAYLFFPQKNGLTHIERQRSIFDGNTVFNENELLNIQALKAYAQKHNYILKPMWTDNMILRFLYAMNFNMSKTLSAIKEHTIWRETYFPIHVDSQLQNFLNSGLLYVHGRDNEFRPLVVFNVSLIDPKKTNIDFIIKALTFWFEYIINQWMLPGQVENWVFIVDLKNIGGVLGSLSSLKKVFQYLSDNYKCRLAALYMVNVSNSVYVPWQIVRKFLDDVTVQKIQFYKTSVPTPLFQIAHRSQVEQKFGGTAPNCTQYWLPVIPSNKYSMTARERAALISKEEYKVLYRAGTLRGMHVNHEFIEEVPDTRNLVLTKTPSKRSLSASSLYDLAQSANKNEPIVNSESNQSTLDSLDNLPGPIEQIPREDSKIDYTVGMDETVGLKKQRSAVRQFGTTFLEETGQDWQ